MSENKMKHAFVYVWGLKGPEGQVWDTTIKREQPKAISKSNTHELDPEQARYAISVLEGMFPFVPVPEEK